MEKQLLEILKSHPFFMDAVDAVWELGFSQWCIGAGVIRNIVFDYLDGSTTTPIRDVDVAYFDVTDLSDQKEKAYEEKLANIMPHVPWEVTNQAAVHLWYHKIFGHPVSPLESIEDAVATWPETCTAVGVSKSSGGSYQVYAPLGLKDLFNMIIRRNPARVDVQTYHSRIETKQYEKLWKSVRIIREDLISNM